MSLATYPPLTGLSVTLSFCNHSLIIMVYCPQPCIFVSVFQRYPARTAGSAGKATAGVPPLGTTRRNTTWGTGRVGEYMRSAARRGHACVASCPSHSYTPTGWRDTMADQPIPTTTETATGLTATAIEQLKGCVRGDLLGPDDADYDSARTIHNGMIDRRPALIVRCAGVADVITAVTFARTHNL